MRVLVGSRTPPDLWFSGEEISESDRPVIRVLAAHSVIGFTDQQFKSIKKSTKYNYLLEQLTNRHVTIAKVDSSENCEFIQTSDFKFSKIADDAGFFAAFDNHTRSADPGETRDLTFHRVFGHLLPSAESFDYADQYFYKKLDDLNSGAFFLIKNLIASGVPRIRIRTLVDPEKGAGFRDLVNKNLALVASKLKPNQTFKIFVYKAGSEFPHDRIGGIEFRHGYLNFQIGYGEKFFSEKEPMSFNAASEVNIRLHSLIQHIEKLPLVDSLPKRN